MVIKSGPLSRVLFQYFAVMQQAGTACFLSPHSKGRAIGAKILESGNIAAEKRRIAAF
jgi:hypothetical protein